MATKVRLARYGTKQTPCYRVVVADSRSPRSGRVLEVLGHYDARQGMEKAVLKKERIAYWQGKGAQLTNSVKQILKHQGPS